VNIVGHVRNNNYTGADGGTVYALAFTAACWPSTCIAPALSDCHCDDPEASRLPRSVPMYLPVTTSPACLRHLVTT